MNTKILLVVLAILIIGGGAWFFFSRPNSAPTAAASTATESNGQTAPSATPAVATASITAGVTVGSKTATVTYTDQGFSPKTVTIAKGDTVQFVDKTSQPMWVASAPHPTHEGYSGTTKDQHCPDTAGIAFDQCAPGMSYTFTFEKVGTWGYHNHFSSNLGGTIVVQ